MIFFKNQKRFVDKLQTLMSTKKFLHTADWHLGKRLLEYSRLPEQERVMNELVELADAQAVDVVLVAGDLFDVFQPSHEAQDLFYKTLFRLSSNGRRPVVAIAGNHDSHALVEAPLPLSRELGIFLLGADSRPITEIVNSAGIKIQSPENGIVLIDFPDGDKADIIVAPYANESLLRTYLGKENAQEMLRTILKTQWHNHAQHYFRKESTRIFMGHFFFMREGSLKEEEPEGERSILHVGGVEALFTEDLPNGLDYAALGHLHRYQTVDNRAFPVVYSSSPLAYSFSEADQTKYAVIYDSGEKTYIAHPLNSGYPLIRKRFESNDDAIEWLIHHQECYVELTLVTDDAIESAVRSSLYKAHPRIVHLIPERRGGANEESMKVGAADLELSTEELFAKYFQSRTGQTLNAELLEAFREIKAKKGGNA